MTDLKRFVMTVYGLVLSTLIGLLASAFLILENTLSEWLWQPTSLIVRMLLVGLGAGLLIALLKRWPQMPQTAQTAMAMFKKHQFGDYRLVFVNLLMTLVILSFGAGVGPEAALLSAIIMLSSWQADKIRYLYFNYDQLMAVPVRTRLQQLFTFNAYLQGYDAQLAVKSPRLLRQKRLLYLVFSLNGLFAFAVLMRQTDQPSFVTKLGATTWQWHDLWLLLPLIVGAVIYGRTWRWLGQQWQRLVERLALPLAVKVAAGAIGILVVAGLAPDLLFSGQHSVHLLIGTWRTASPWFLTGMTALKLIFLAWCLQFHWRGGDIFPVLFASLAQGFAVAAWLPSFDALFVVAVVATAMAGSLLDSPIVAGIMVLLFCPVNLWLVILISTLILVLAPRLFKKLTEFKLKRS